MIGKSSAAALVVGGLLCGCSAVPQWPGARVVFLCPSGFYLATDRLCHSWAGTPNNYATAANDPPASYGWGRDAAIAAGSALVGGIAGRQLAKRATGAAADEAAGDPWPAETGGSAGDTAAYDPPAHGWGQQESHPWGGSSSGAEAGATAAETTGGAEAGAAAEGAAMAGGEAAAGAEAGAAEGLVERGLIWAGEAAVELLPFGISSHQSWRALVRHPVYAAPISGKGKTSWTLR